MEATDNLSDRIGKTGLLYPMMLIAAIAVIVFSVVGIATMMGWMPQALSGDDRATASGASPSSHSSAPPAPAAPSRAATNASKSAAASVPSGIARVAAVCPDCGVVESIRPVETQGDTSWVGAAGGAVVGGLLGNQVGSGRGRTAATVAGAAGGAFAGNQIEKRMNKSISYRVRVRMEDGSLRTFTDSSQPGYAVGQKVRVTDKGIVSPG